MTAPLRESPGPAAGASRPASAPPPLTPRLVLRVLGVATLVGLFICLFGPFGDGLDAFLVRAAMNLTFGWVGSLLGLTSVRLAWRLGFYRQGFWVIGLVSGLMMVPPMGLVVWCGVSLWSRRWLPASALPGLLWDTTLICIGACFAAVLLSRRAAIPTAGPSAVKFLERLPIKLRGAEVWAVEAEDHYLRLHTSKGQDLILLRLADAIAELEGIEGAQVHRSWWVARDAIADAKRGDGRATLILKDGAEAPVSRTYAGLLRERGWI